MIEKNPHFGSSFEDFLQEEGIADEVNAAAIKHVLAWQIEQAMKEQGISKNQMAKRMHTSRAYLDRFLDPNNDKVQLDTMQRAAAAVGRKLRFELALAPTATTDLRDTDDSGISRGRALSRNS
jgi:antitoxin HicB